MLFSFHKLKMLEWSVELEFFFQVGPSQMYHCILIALTFYINGMTLFLKKNKNILLKRFTYIFLLTYTLNAPKINDLYMTKKSILKGK